MFANLDAAVDATTFADDGLPLSYIRTDVSDGDFFVNIHRVRVFSDACSHHWLPAVSVEFFPILWGERQPLGS